MANHALPTPDIALRSAGRTARVGDELVVARGSAVAVDVSVDPKSYGGDRIELVWSGETVASATVPEDGRISFTRFPPANGYLRVQIVGADNTLRVIANPIFVTVD